MAAVFLRAAAHYAAHIDVPYKTAFGASLLSYLCHAIFLAMAFFIMTTAPHIMPWPTLNIPALFLGSLTTMYAYGFMIKAQDEKPIGFRKAVRIYLLQLALGFGLAALMGFIVYWLIRLGGALT